MTYLTVHLDDDTDVDFYPDGSSRVGLGAMRVARHDLCGYVWFDADGKVASSQAEDAYVDVPLRPHVVRAAVNAAWKKARTARRAAKQIAASRGPVRRLEPGTLEHLCMLAEGSIREDGWPRGHMPL